ncbi:hypothetical protein NHQ30_003622 [Ciborinia camelliae]|nr:hypothetical protein NHQ30_003622 [Ciborinia camelliae]
MQPPPEPPTHPIHKHQRASSFHSILNHSSLHPLRTLLTRAPSTPPPPRSRRPPRASPRSTPSNTTRTNPSTGSSKPSPRTPSPKRDAPKPVSQNPILQTPIAASTAAIKIVVFHPRTPSIARGPFRNLPFEIGSRIPHSPALAPSPTPTFDWRVYGVRNLLELQLVAKRKGRDDGIREAEIGELGDECADERVD